MQRKLILSSLLLCGLFYYGSVFTQEPPKVPETKAPENWAWMPADALLLQMSYPNGASAAMNLPPGTPPGQLQLLPGGVQPQVFPPNPMMGGNNGAVSMFMKLREDITAQLRQLTQMTQSLGPQDERLKAMLAEQQRELLQQLKEVNQQIAAVGGPTAGSPTPEASGMTQEGNMLLVPMTSMPAMPVPSPPTAAGNQPFFSNNQAFPFGPGIEPMNTPNMGNPDHRIMLLQQAVRLVREAGCEALAQQILHTIQNGGLTPNAMPGIVNPQPPVGWAGSDPALRSSIAFDPFAAAPVKEIAELQQSMAQIKDENAKLVSSIDEIKTQLSLIGHKITTPVETPKE